MNPYKTFVSELDKLLGQTLNEPGVTFDKVALVITTNLHFSEWVQIFGDERLTAALLDRLTHHSIIVELSGESFRFRQRLSQQDLN